MANVKLKDVIRRANTKVDKDNTDLIYYVGGEHIESEQIRVEKRGIIAGSTIGPMFYYGFKKGDFLLVSRNPHLKKAGIVDFDGICSEKTFVLESSNPEVLAPEFLPFILQNERFWGYAYQHRHGSTNTFINWSTLADYEFELPILEEQHRLANVLWSVVDTMKAYKKLLSATDELVKSQFIELFGDPIANDKGWETKPLKSVAPECRPSIPKQERYWWLNLDMIESYSGYVVAKVYESIENIGNSTSTFDDTMVLYSKLRPYLNKVIVPDDFGYATTELVGLKPDERVLNKYFLFNLLRGDQFVSYANGLSAGGQMPRMPMKEMRNFQCILPPLELQERFVEFYKQSDKSKFGKEMCDKWILEIQNSWYQMYRILHQ